MERAIERLRDATRSLHDEVDGSAYARAVAAGAVPVDRYASFLRAMWQVHAALERALEAHPDPELRVALARTPERRARLVDDLAALGVDPYGVDLAAIHALRLARRMRADVTAALYGYGYVLEGSQLGGLLQHQRLVERPEFHGGGLAYLAGAGRDTRAQFGEFVARLDASLRDPAAVDRAVEAARATFACFVEVVRALDPARPAAHPSARDLHDAGGNHPIPDDLRELSAAMDAGEQSYRAWHYYGARYGARGLRFTHGDSAWLATLGRGDDDTALQQTQWLAGVLASRGMPRRLLEEHLDVLRDTLRRASPERGYAPLARAASELRRARESAQTDAERDAVRAAFYPAGVSSREHPWREGALDADEAAALLAAAVADERCGVAGAVTSLATWMSDPTRFTPRWIAAVERALAAARRAQG